MTDLEAETAAADYVALEHRVVAYRELLSIALALLHERDRQVRTVRERHDALVQELRSFRRSVMQKAIAA